jgi:hypothetical protein
MRRDPTRDSGNPFDPNPAPGMRDEENAFHQAEQIRRQGGVNLFQQMGQLMQLRVRLMPPPRARRREFCSSALDGAPKPPRAI